MYFNARRQILRAADALEAWLSRYWELVLAALILLVALLISGCAEYEIRQPIADSGTVLLTWEIGYVPGTHCGYAREIAKDHWLVTFRRKPDFNSLCWPHELLHPMKGEHQ